MSYFLRSFFNRNNMPFAVLGVVLILVGLDYYKPGLLSDFGWIGRTALGIMFAAGGLYIVYTGLESKTKADDLMSVFFGLLLFTLAAFFGFGIDVTGVMNSLFSTLKMVIPWIIASTLGLIGLAYAGRPGKYNQWLGLAMIAAALGITLYSTMFR